MRTIALVTQKGGSGKSTLSAGLAVAAQAARERVFLIDMDPQKSLTTWAQNRQDENLGVEAVMPHKLPAALAALAQGNVTLVIIDTPATLSTASEAARLAWLASSRSPSARASISRIIVAERVSTRLVPWMASATDPSRLTFLANRKCEP